MIFHEIPIKIDEKPNQIDPDGSTTKLTSFIQSYNFSLAKDQTEVFDACILDPPYTGKAEKYGSDPRDIGQMDYQEYLKKLDTI